VALISLQPNELSFPRLGREISFDDLLVDASIPRKKASKGRSEKKTARSLHEITFTRTDARA
jgi:hypothetical protein